MKVDQGERLSSALIRRARSAHFAALAAVALVASAAHLLTWQSFTGFREATDMVSLMDHVMQDTGSAARSTQGYASGLFDEFDREWYLHQIERLSGDANAKQVRIETALPHVFPEAKALREAFDDAETYGQKVRADIARLLAPVPSGSLNAQLVALQKDAATYQIKAEEVRDQMRDIADLRMDQARLFGLSGLLLILLGLLVEGHFLFRPLVHRLASAIRVEREKGAVERENAHLARLQRATEDAYREVESHRAALQTQARALEDALRRAEEASRLKSEFLANMSHEIRTPLNGVVGMTEILSRSNLSPRQMESVQTISTSAESLLRIINDILDLSKVEAGKLTVEPAPFNIRELLNGVLDLQSKPASEKGLKLSVRVKEGSEENLVGDAARIRQIVTNLVSNAVKFTERGSVEVKAETFESDGDLMLRVDVVDTGIGIDPARLPELFDPFTQADGSTTRTYGGTGLGLAIVKQLCELMGGWAGGESEPGSGSSFWAVIEVQPAEEHLVVSPDRPVKSVHLPAGLRILLVEDNAVNQLVGIRLLEAEKCAVTVAQDGAEAVELFRRGQWDLVLMDVHMPGMDGLEATRTMRTLETGRLRRTPIVAMTADAMEREVRRAMEAGMDGFLSKPVRSAELREVLALWAVPVGTP
jgi:signal transduction histidine kinase/CheY-like chemotaxis protein